MILAGLILAGALLAAHIAAGALFPDLPPSDRPHLSGRTLRRTPRFLQGD